VRKCQFEFLPRLAHYVSHVIRTIVDERIRDTSSLFLGDHLSILVHQHRVCDATFKIPRRKHPPQAQYCIFWLIYVYFSVGPFQCRRFQVKTLFSLNNLILVNIIN
jgi:hypothetical protein